MAHILDLEDVQRMLDECRAKIGDAVLGDTEEACLARHEVEVASSTTIWRATEINRRTDPRHIIGALLRGAAASIGGEILTNVPEDKRAQVAIGICGELLSYMLKAVTDAEDVRANYSRMIDAKEVGTA